MFFRDLDCEVVIKGDDEGIACTNCNRAHEGNTSSYRVRVLGLGSQRSCLIIIMYPEFAPSLPWPKSQIPSYQVLGTSGGVFSQET